MTFLLLLVLLLLSAFFSGSETAFFSLDRMDRIRLREKQNRGAKTVLRLLEHPRDLLVAILFGNVLVNILYFSVANSIAIQARGYNRLLEPVAHAGALITIIVAGEVIPKTLTIGAPAFIARAVSPFLALWQRLSRFLTEPLSYVTGKSLSLVDRRWPPPGALTDMELAQLVALQSKEGILAASVSDLLEDVLLLSRVRVKEIMTPRVDIFSFDLTEGREAFLNFVATIRRSKILVHNGTDLDGIHGVLNVKKVIQSPKKSLNECVEKAWFIPVTKSVESLLQEMLIKDASLAVVVDEYGGTAGLVTMEDVIEEVVGDISKQTNVPPIQASGPNCYSVAGSMTVRDVNDVLNLKIEETSTTVAGFVARSLGRIPVVGDQVPLRLGHLRVTKVEKLRTTQVLIEVQRASSGEFPVP
ncbi:MAG: hemolysin family protein [Planctomycetota bacterium]|nr:hemolysin family protein [Planctomycetota bacterium]